MGSVSAEEAALLHVFVDDGLPQVPDRPRRGVRPRASTTKCRRIWEERPADLAISLFDGPTAFSDYDGRVRNVGYRIPDLHSHSAHALDLYLHPTLFRMVELIYDQPAISFQSLYFEYGSQQALHRDPMYVVTDPPSHLLASWVALEDISPDSGPLAYVPTSHRLPWFEFDARHGGVRAEGPGGEAGSSSRNGSARRIRDRGLDVKAFTCRRGDAFIWHAGLLHGGTPDRRPGADAEELRRALLHGRQLRVARARACACETATVGGANIAAPTT